MLCKKTNAILMEDELRTKKNTILASMRSIENVTYVMARTDKNSIR